MRPNFRDVIRVCNNRDDFEHSSDSTQLKRV